MQITRLVVLGAGDLGSRVARLWLARSPQQAVVGLTKTPARHEALRALGVQPATARARELLALHDALLVAVPGTETKAEVLTELAALPPPRRAVFVSTTGYYGTPRGMVNEETPAGATRRAREIADLEAQFRRWAGAAGVVMRLGGLYRPGRGPMAALARRGDASKKAPNRPLPLIHYDDAASAVYAALRRAEVEPLYLAVTPPCPTRLAFYSAACARLALPLPEFAPPLPHPPARFDVRRLRRDLLPAPAYPHWQAALVQAE